MENQKSDKVIEVNKEDEIIFAGLFAFDSVAVTQLIAASQIDNYLKTSVCCFSIAIPLLAILLFVKRGERTKTTSFTSVTQLGAYFVSTIISLIGIVVLFFHFSFSIGMCFLVSAACSTVLWIKFLRWRKDRL